MLKQNMEVFVQEGITALVTFYQGVWNISWKEAFEYLHFFSLNKHPLLKMQAHSQSWAGL